MLFDRTSNILQNDTTDNFFASLQYRCIKLNSNQISSTFPIHYYSIHLEVESQISAQLQLCCLSCTAVSLPQHIQSHAKWMMWTIYHEWINCISVTSSNIYTVPICIKRNQMFLLIESGFLISNIILLWMLIYTYRME